MARSRWTTRNTVEECCAICVSDLVRSGVFRAETGTSCSIQWTRGADVRQLTFQVLRDADGEVFLRFSRVVAGVLPGQRIQHLETVRTNATNCRFGGRRWWLECPYVTRGIPCGRRIRILYLKPGESDLGCRKCLDLTHSSAQEHDSRVDRLVRMPVAELNHALQTGSLKQRLLAVRACTALYRRQVRQALSREKRREARRLAVKTQEHGQLFVQTRC